MIFHIGVNNVQKDNEQTILRKYQEQGESVQIERVCFSSIIKRDHRSELNLKMMNIKKALKKLCLQKGQHILTSNFLNHLKN